MMKIILLFVAATLVCGIIAVQDFDLIRRSSGTGNDDFPSSTTTLYLGYMAQNGVTGITIYKWNDVSKKYVLRSNGNNIPNVLPVEMITDSTQSQLIAILMSSSKNIGFINLGNSTVTPYLTAASKFNNTQLKDIALDRSDKYLLISDYKNQQVVAYEWTASDGLTKSVASYETLQKNHFPVKIDFHPTVSTVLAVLYKPVNKILFLKFDGSTNSASFKKSSIEVDIPNVCTAVTFVFSQDGEYMYVPCSDRHLLSYKVTVDNKTDDVTSVTPIGNTTTVARQSDQASYPQIAVHPTANFLYVLEPTERSVAIFVVDSDTGKLSSNGLEKIEGGSVVSLDVTPDGSKLLVTDSELGVAVYRISSGGKLTLGKPISVDMRLISLLATKK